MEVDPGHGKPVPEGGTIQVANSLPDIDPDEIYSALDADTRPYLKLLVAGAGKGLKDRGDDLREVFRRLEPIHRDLARVTRATAVRRTELKELIHDYGLLMTELGKHPQDLRRLVTASHTVFDTLAKEDTEISEAVARLPGSLNASTRALANVRQFAPVLRSSLESLRPAIRQAARDERRRHAVPAQTEPIIRTQIRPFVRAARPWTNDLRFAAEGTAKAMPDLKTLVRRAEALLQHGRVQPGRRGEPRRQVDLAAAPAPGGLPVLARVGRPERHVAVLHGRRSGPVAPGHDLRRARPRCSAGIVQGVISDVAESNPALGDLLTTPGPGGTSPADQLLNTQFGSCDFNALPTTPPPDSGGGLPIIGDLPRCRSSSRHREQEPAKHRTDRRNGRLHAVRGGAPDVPVGVVRRHAAAAAGELPLQGGVPRGLAARQGGRRADGGREHRQGEAEGARAGRALDGRRRWSSTTGSRRSGSDAHAILRQKSLLGETYVEITPGTAGAPKLADGGTLPSAQVDNSVRARRGVPRVRPGDAEGVPAVAPRGGHRHERHLRARLQRLARERGAVLHGRRATCCGRWPSRRWRSGACSATPAACSTPCRARTAS